MSNFQNNARPVLDIFANPALTSIAEDTVNPIGNTIAEIIVDGSITDADVSGAAPEAIAVFGVDNTNGTWQYQIEGGAWTNFDFSGANAGRALLLDSSDRIRFVPNANYNGISTFSFRAWDRTSGSRGNYSALVSGDESGTLNLSFANNGIAYADISFGPNIVTSIAAGNDGKIIMAGYKGWTSGYTESVFARFNADGTPDSSFGNSGRVIAPFSTGYSEIRKVHMLRDGSILAAGAAWQGGSPNFLLVKLTSSGTPASGFGNGGEVVTNSGGFIRDLVIQDDGKVVVAGRLQNAGFAVARYNADGSIDTSFNGNGIISLSLGNQFDEAVSVTITPDKKILVAGYYWQNLQRYLGLVRFNSNGTLDTSFDGDGKLLRSERIVAGDESINLTVISLADGKFLVGANVDHFTSGIPNPFVRNQFATVYRFNADGSLDGSFNPSYGGANIIGIDYSYLNDLKVANDGKIVLGLSVGRDWGSNFDFASARLNPDGTLDTGFGDNGITTVNISTLNFEAHDRVGAIALDAAGNIFIGGYSNQTTGPGADTQFALVQLKGNSTLSTFSSESDSATISIAPVNDAPVLDLNGSAPGNDFATAFKHSVSGGTIVAPGLHLTDVDNPRINGASVRLTNLLNPGWEFLSADTTGTNIATNYNAGTGVLELRNLDTLANYQKVLRTITYGNSSQNPTPGERRVTFSVNDSMADSNQPISTVILVPGNANPVLDPLAAPALMNIAEDTFNPGGNTIAEIIVDGSISYDGVSVALPEAIAVFAVDNTNGTWQYQIGGGAWTNFDLSGTNAGKALLLDGSDRIRFVPYLNYNGSSSFSFRAWDRTSGNRGTYSGLFSGGTWNRSFGNNGVASADFSGEIGYGRSITVTGDGKILVAGSSSSTSGGLWRSFFLRFKNDGTPDTDFGVGGKATVALSNGNNGIQKVHSLADGSILATGYVSVSSLSTSFAAVKLTASGTLDPGFGTGGTVITNLGANSYVSDSVIANDGKIVAAGWLQNAGFTVVRYNANGSLDMSFNGNGVASVSLAGQSDQATSVALTPDNKILVAGIYRPNPQPYLGLIRLNNNGTLDTGFDGDGKLLLPDVILADYELSNIKVTSLAGGKFLVGTTVDYTNGLFPTLYRFNSNGTLDTGFGNFGRLRIGINNSRFKDLQVADDGKLVLGLNLNRGTFENPNYDFAAVRLNSDGSLDTSFGNNGITTVSINGRAFEIAGAIAVDPSGNVLIGGYTSLSATFNGNPQVALIQLKGDSISSAFTRESDSATVTVTPVNDPPLIDLNGINAGSDFWADFRENSPAVSIVSSGLTLTDPDSNQVNSVVVRISNLTEAGWEILSADTSGTNIAATYYPDTGVLELRNFDTIANYQKVLRTFTYVNTSPEPIPGIRTIIFSANDSFANGNNAISLVNVLSVNDRPLINGSNPSTNFAENTTGIVYTVTVSDPDSDQFFYSLSGDDAGLFNVNDNGEITFKVPPDFETPFDKNGDNLYQINVTVSDGSLTDTETLSIAVDDLSEARVIDGPIAGAMVFFDANNNGVKDLGEPSGLTDMNGYFVLPIADSFDTDGNGKIDPSEGRYVVTGGTDTITGKPFTSTLKALADSQFITPLTTLVNELVTAGATPTAAENQVKAALGLPANLTLGTFDPIEAAQSGSTDGQKVLSAQVAVQTLINLIASSIVAVASNADAGTVNNAISTVLVNHIAQGNTLNLSDAAQVQSLLTGTIDNLTAADNTLALQALSDNLSQISQIVAASSGAILNATTTTDIFKAQKVAQSDTAGELVSALENNDSLDTVVANNTGDALAWKVYTTTLNPLAVATNDSLSTYKSQGTGGNVLSNDSTIGNGTLAVTAVNGNPSSVGQTIVLGSGALLTLNPDGTFFYNPNGKFESVSAGNNGSDSFTYTVGGNNSSDTAVVNLTILPNSAPTSVLISGNTIAENTPAGFAIGDLNALDPDPGDDTFSYSLVDDPSTDNALFAVEGNRIRSAAIFDYEAKNTYNLRVRVRDRGDLTYEQTLTINVTNVNEAPVITKNFPATVNPGSTATIGTNLLQTLDQDNNGWQLTYTLTALPGAGTLRLSGRALTLGGTFTQSDIDFNRLTYLQNSTNRTSSGDSFSFSVSDGVAPVPGTVTGTAAININRAPLSVGMTKSNVDENVPANTTVGSFITTDANAGDTFTYSLVPGIGSTDNAKFSIVGSQLRIRVTPDYEVKNSYSIRVRATDNGRLFTDQLLLIGVNDLKNIVTGTSSNQSFRATNDVDDIQGMGGNDAFTVDIANFGAYDNFNGDSATDPSIGGTDGFTLTGGINNQILGLDLSQGANQFVGLSGKDMTGVILRNFENVTLTGFGGSATLAGNEVVNKLTAGAGNDSLSGGGGNDSLVGAAGDDYLDGGLGNDNLNAGIGSDTLVGGAGNDVITLGLDTSSDSIVYYRGDGTDTVSNFSRGTDILNFNGIAAIDVQVSGANTVFRVGDGIAGNRAFGAGASLLTVSGVSGFNQADVGVDLFGSNFFFS
ncbi:MAG: hypothetical protein N5P05_000544 [Chroococcopsis gigantea SAG 12.99]|jgi:uncharacterized delta-60 repeat protein|nr:cadherin domain-containing protein [Chlorogloea purpurea SAG 13.99]MDV2998938.1 hypothetical protein [Chroococcopsis gigantea SAG 12.99]